MKIRFISSLDSEDEFRFAKAILAGLAKLLDEFPIAYTIRLETASGQVIEHHHAHAAAMNVPQRAEVPVAVEKSTSLGRNVSPIPLKTDPPE